MPRRCSIKTDWASLESGAPEERAGFAAINISAHGVCLTAGHDRLLQKVQRAFAAEFLSPFRAVDEMLDGDDSMESQQDAAHHFCVSDVTIRTLLASYDRISRSELDVV